MNAEFGEPYDQASSEQQAVLRQRLQDTVRKNNYDAAGDKLTIEPIRARVFEENLKNYSEIFTNGSKEYAIQRNPQSDPVKLRQLNSFFRWMRMVGDTLFAVVAVIFCYFALDLI